MVMKLNLGIARKMGLPEYGSLQAVCHVEFEVEGAMLTDLDRFHHEVRHGFVACTQAVDDELHRHRERESEVKQRPHNGSSNGRSPKPDRPASEPQCKALYAITKRQRLDLKQLLRDRFQIDRPQDLSLRDASRLIDELNSRT